MTSTKCFPQVGAVFPGCVLALMFVFSVNEGSAPAQSARWSGEVNSHQRVPPYRTADKEIPDRIQNRSIPVPSLAGQRNRGERQFPARIASRTPQNASNVRSSAASGAVDARPATRPPSHPTAQSRSQPENPFEKRPAEKRSEQVAQEIVTHTLTLRDISVASFDKILREKLGKRCVAISDSQRGPNVSRLQVETEEGTSLLLTFDATTNAVRMEGSKNAVAAFGRIAKLLDVKKTSAKIQTDLVPYSKVNYRAVRRTVTAIEENQNDVPFFTLNSASAPATVSTIPDASAPEPAANGRNSAEPGFEFDRAPNAKTIADANAMLGQMAQIGLIGQVQLEVFGEFGVIAIKGSQRDVEIVRQLIELIEQVGIDQEPEIVIYPMEHSDCVRLGTLVRLFYNEIYGPRRGNINITPLVKPNALILVGKKESIETAVELIKKLDLPVDPNHEFKVVRLKHAVANVVQQTLTTHFSYSSQMASQVLVTADARTNSVILQASPRDMLAALALIEKIDASEGEAEMQVKVFKLLNSGASELASLLQEGILGSGTGGFTAGATERNTLLEFVTIDNEEREILRTGIISSDIRFTADTRSNSLVVKAPQDTMPLLAALIHELDGLPVAQSQVKVFQLLNGDANSLYNMLQTLFQTQTTTGGAGTNTLVSRPGITEGESTMVQLRFSVDVRTNSIIAVGTAGDLETIEMLLLRLDDEHMQQRNRYVRVFRLLNAPANEVSTVLNNYIREESAIDTTDGELFSVYEQYRREVVVVEDNVTNSILVSSTPRYFEMIRRIIQELDERPPMVVIQVLIAEVTLNNLDEFGVEFGLQDSILFDRSVGGNPGFNFNTSDTLGNNTAAPYTDTVGSQGITNLGVGRAGSTGVGGFVFSASSESVSVLLRALNERGKVNVLSRPEVTALDNQRASIVIGQSIPYTASTNVTDGGSERYNTEFENAGLVFDVTPRINADGLVMMDVYIEKSVADMTISTLGPTKNQSVVQTVLSAMDGQTVVIGGMITTEDTHTTRAVPFLSDIPVVGRLFEYNSRKCQRKELLVILTPTIIRSEEDMNRVRMMEIRRVHWCVDQVMSISTARDLRQRGEYFSPEESTVIPYDGKAPGEEMFPRLEGVDRLDELDQYRSLPGAPQEEGDVYFEDIAPIPLRPGRDATPQPHSAPEQPRTVPGFVP